MALIRKSVFEKWFAGSTGDPPVPSGDSPDETGAAVRGNEHGLFATLLVAVPVGGSPTGAGESPAPPIFKTGAQQETQLGFQKPNLDTNGAVTLDEWHRFDANAGPKENFSALDVNGGAQINATEFLTQAPKHAKRFHFFADQEKTNKYYSSRHQEEFQQPGGQLFSIRF